MLRIMVGTRRLELKWLGTHKEYDAIEVRTIQYATEPIRTEADHNAALREIELLWGAEEGTSNGDRLDVLTTLVEAYEEAHFPIDEGSADRHG